MDRVQRDELEEKMKKLGLGPDGTMLGAAGAGMNAMTGAGTLGGGSVGTGGVNGTGNKLGGAGNLGNQNNQGNQFNNLTNQGYNQNGPQGANKPTPQIDAQGNVINQRGNNQ